MLHARNAALAPPHAPSGEAGWSWASCEEQAGKAGTLLWALVNQHHNLGLGLLAKDHGFAAAMKAREGEQILSFREGLGYAGYVFPDCTALLVVYQGNRQRYASPHPIVLHHPTGHLDALRQAARAHPGLRPTIARHAGRLGGTTVVVPWAPLERHPDIAATKPMGTFVHSMLTSIVQGWMAPVVLRLPPAVDTSPRDTITATLYSAAPDDQGSFAPPYVTIQQDRYQRRLFETPAIARWGQAVGAHLMANPPGALTPVHLLGHKGSERAGGPSKPLMLAQAQLRWDELAQSMHARIHHAARCHAWAIPAFPTMA